MKMQDYFEDDLPFEVNLSFEKAFEFWEEMANSTDGAERARASYVLDELSKVPALRKPIEDSDILDKYEKEVGLLLSCFFPKALQLNEIKAATIPFSNLFIHTTSRFQNIKQNAGENFTIEFRNLEDKYLMSSTYILNVLYGANINLNRPMVFDLYDEKTEMLRTYRGFINADFIELKKTPKSPELTPSDIDHLINNMDDLALWKEMIPPRSFEMVGFGILTIFDITADDALAGLKLNLFDQDSFYKDEKLRKIENNLKKLFSISDLKLGISVMQGDSVYSIGGTRCSSLSHESKKCTDRDDFFCSYSRDHLISQKKTMVIPNLEDIEAEKSPLLRGVVDQGIKSYIITPLMNNSDVIGMLELGSGKHDVLNPAAERRLESIVPLFTTALQRSLEDYWTSLEAIIKKNCTAIHPAVEWRFLEEAAKAYNEDIATSEATMQEIVFERVVPLYGQMDISGSSKFRDQGIQKDLRTQLKLAKKVIKNAIQDEPLLVYEQLETAIDKRIDGISKKLNAGDESSILDFLKYEVEPVFEHLLSLGKSTKAIAAYRDRIDPVIQMVYEGRRDYEETVNFINREISAYIENSQLQAQKMFPHYFEKYKTDGVEYNVYIGDTLVKDRKYHPMYLKNLRLWQLILTCEVENLLHKMKPNFKVPLEIASLILVQNKELAIKFRYDEKQFDVDGAYNARYEIVKKRVDKAKLRNSEERLTQPGKLAIVYSSTEERREYNQYLDFMIEREYILPEVEHLELEELQGAAGLRAIRVSINYQEEHADKQLSRQVKELVSELE